MRGLVSFLLISVVWGLSRIFYRHEVEWLGDVPPDRWKGIRLVAILNHTSLYEPILAGVAPISFIRQVAWHGVIPVARKTMERPLTGRFFKLIAKNVVSISRQRDDTWSRVLEKIEDPQSLVLIAPEGRMKRPGGLDSEGRPMTVRSGVAEIIEAIPDGRLLLAYSEGLHHVQAPGERLPRLFQRVGLKMEVVEVVDYRDAMRRAAGDKIFARAVVNDLTRRRDQYCRPPEEE